MARVNSYVHVRGEGGETAVLAPGDTVPSWASVTNPAVLDADTETPAPEPESTPEPEPTPEPAPASRKRTAHKAAPASE